MRRFLRLPHGRIEREVDDEIAFHIESRVDDLLHAGATEEQARRIAEIEFGDRHASRRELAAVDRHRRRRQRTAEVFGTLGQDLRYAVRGLRRSPAFALTSIVTLVIGIGAAAATFAIVNGVLLRPLPFKDPDRLVGAWHDFPAIGLNHGQQAAITFFTYRQLAHTIEGIGVYDVSAVNVAEDVAATAPRRVATALFSASLFPVLGVAPARGRVFTEAEDAPNAPPVMLISDAMWRADFGGDPRVIGRTLDVNGVRREIVGIMPPSFRFPSAETELWIPLALDPSHPPGTAFRYGSVARLKPGVRIDEAQRDFAAVLPRVAELFPQFVAGITTRAMLDQVKPRPVLTPLQEDVTGGIAGTLWIIAASAGLLLLVACVNVANLGLVRFDARQQEVAIREALGGGRRRVMRYYITESALLAAVAGALAVAAAWVATRALVTSGPATIPRLTEITFDARSIGFGVVASGLAALGACLIPAVRIGRGSLALRESARGGTSSRHQHRVRSALVAIQIALGLVALASSGLLLRSFRSLHTVRPGFDPQHVATFWLSLPRPRYVGDSDVVRFFSTLIDRVGALPGVESVALTSRLPLMSRGVNPNPIYPENAPAYETKLPPLQMFTTVTSDYFRTMRIPLLAGRTFEPMQRQRDGDAIIASTTAKFFWNDSTGGSVLGKRFRALPTGNWYTVVGVVADTRDTTLASAPAPTVYLPETIVQDKAARGVARTMALAIRTIGDASSTLSAAQRVVREMDPTLPTFDVGAMTDAVHASTSRLAFTIMILGSAAAVTLVLGGVGLYGMLASVVALRRRELAIRIALGASPRAIIVATTRQGIVLTTVGVATGVVLFVATARFMQAFLFGVAPWDPLTIATAALVLLSIAAVASAVPARRAGRVDPAEVLRAQ